MAKNKAQEIWKNRMVNLLADYHTFLATEFDQQKMEPEEYADTCYILGNLEGRILADASLNTGDLDLLETWEQELREIEEDGHEGKTLRVFFHFDKEFVDKKWATAGRIQDALERIKVYCPRFVWLTDEPDKYGSIQLLMEITFHYDDLKRRVLEWRISRVSPFTPSDMEWEEN